MNSGAKLIGPLTGQFKAKLTVKLTVIAFPLKLLIVIGIIWGLVIAPGQAETVYFQTMGQAGYRVQGTLEYSQPTSNLVTVNAHVSQPPFWNLRVNFYDPQGHLWHSYHHLSSQPLNNPYLQLTFDRQQQQFQDGLDLGGSDPQAVFLKGVPGQQLQWMAIEAQGQERLLDQNQGWLAIAVQETAPH